MGIKKNLVISITDYSDELNGIPNTVGIDFRTLDGAICIEPKGNKVIVKDEDLEAAIAELKAFKNANPASKTVVETTLTPATLSFEYQDDEEID